MSNDDRSARYRRLAMNGGRQPPAFQTVDFVPPPAGPARLVDIALPPPLGDLERGCIITPSVTLGRDKPSLSFRDGCFDLQAVRCAVLMFDRVVQPDNNGFSIGNLQEECDGLEIVQKSFATFEGAVTPDVLRTTAVETFNRLDERENGRWSVVRNAQENVFPEECLSAVPALKLKLEGALPFPDREVPLEDVLAFKQRRTGELMALREYLDSLVLEANRNGLSGLSQTHALEQLVGAIEDYNKCMREQNFLKRLTNLEIKFNWLSTLPAASVILLEGVTLTCLAALGAGVASSISMESTLGLRSRNSGPGPLEYLFEAKSTL